MKKILIVDDLTPNRRILSGMLSGEYEILEATGGFAALDILTEKYNEISAVLLDISMPDINGYEVLRRMKAKSLLSSIPVIMITGTEDESARLKSLSLGANDFVMKPYNSEIMKHCLRNTIALHESAFIINELERDKLTGLLSRETFLKHAEEMIKSKPAGYYVMTVFNVDKFKVINDQNGSEKGNMLLKHIANVFNEGFVPHGGICSRLFADVFAVLYPYSFMNSYELADIREKATHFAGIVAPIVFTIGRYIVNDTTIQTSIMLDRASMAAATIKGRFDIKIAEYNESMRIRLIEEQQIVTEMESALRGGQFEVWYQPQVNHSTGAQVGAEALVRWRHPEKGLISPGLFIPIFEKNGFIYELDKFVWEKVCANLREWCDGGRNPLPVSVNISRYDIFRSDIADVISGLMKLYNLPPELLRLEITETAFAESAEQIIEVVKDLIARGFTVEIDDFGSGYSSLNTLKDVPAQILKLDMRFIDSKNAERGGNIVESVVRMAKWLGMSVIAEGVESIEQADFLRSVGCSYIQGFLYARPMPVNQYLGYCSEALKEEKLITIETVENLNNNSFWSPESIDTLIFNSYVGGACIFEYHNGRVELLRATEKYAQVIGSVGMTVEDALKLDWAEHLDEENGKRVIADLEQSIAEKKEITNEYVFLDLPGAPHETYLRSTMRVIATAENRYLVYCTNENITAQRLAERKEKRLAQRFETIMQNVNSGIAMHSASKDGVLELKSANDKYFAILGHAHKESEASLPDIMAMIHPEDRELVLASVVKLIADRIPSEDEYRFIKPDGSTVWVHGNKSIAYLDEYGEDIVISVLTDITKRVTAEKAATQTSKQLRNMMDDMPGGYARLQILPDGHVIPIYVNEGYCKMVGLSYGEVMRIHGENSLAGVHPDDVPDAEKAIALMLATHEPQSLNYRLRIVGGEYMRVNIFCRVTEDSDGNVYLNSYYTE